jgi:hypothetical protein
MVVKFGVLVQSVAKVSKVISTSEENVRSVLLETSIPYPPSKANSTIVPDLNLYSESFPCRITSRVAS